MKKRLCITCFIVLGTVSAPAAAQASGSARRAGGLGPVETTFLPTDTVAMTSREGTISLLVRETAQDLNGDGDTDDLVVHVRGRSGAITNLGLSSMTSGNLFGDVLQFNVSEEGHGEQDLNGDGDTLDSVAFAYDLDAGTILSSATSTWSGDPDVMRHTGRWVCIPVSEYSQGQTDLNGDGDSRDLVPHFWDLQSRTVASTGMALYENAYYLFVHESFLLFPADEREEGDLNGDGDALDPVLVSVDLETGNVQVTGLALSVAQPDFFQADGPRSAFLVDESAQGADLNADGDLGDDVLHTYNTQTGLLLNLERGVRGARTGPGGHGGTSYGIPFRLDERRLYFVVEEEQEGADWNGDADQDDSVLHVYDFASGTTTNLGLAAHSFVPGAKLLAFDVLESFQGADLNGDGDTADLVAHVHTFASGTTHNLRLAVPGVSYGPVLNTPRFEVAGALAAFRVNEFDQGGIDVNESGILEATAPAFHDIRTGSSVILPYRVVNNTGWIDIDSRRFAFAAREPSGVDFNGDGDHSDAVFFVHYPRTGVTLNIGRVPVYSGLSPDLRPRRLRRSEGAYLFLTDEFFDGPIDRNGDGDLGDRLPTLIRMRP